MTTSAVPITGAGPHQDQPKELPLTLVLGTEVRCADGACGRLSRLVLDPVANTLTHLVVLPHHDPDGGRLVPVSLLDPHAHDVALTCTRGEFVALETARESEFILADAGLSQHSAPALLWPYYALGTGGLAAMAISRSGVQVSPPEGVVVTHDRLPLGEVDVVRHQKVIASDGPVGKVHGLVLDASDHQVTHVLLAEGHAFGRRDVAIPIASVEKVSTQVLVRLTKQEITELPSVDVAAHAYGKDGTCIGWMPSPWAVRL